MRNKIYPYLLCISRQFHCPIVTRSDLVTSWKTKKGDNLEREESEGIVIRNSMAIEERLVHFGGRSVRIMRARQWRVEFLL